MSCPELPKTYDFKETEEELYRDWNDAGYFQPSNDPKKAGFDPSVPSYIISIPPTNKAEKEARGIRASAQQIEERIIKKEEGLDRKLDEVAKSRDALSAQEREIEKEKAALSKFRDYFSFFYL